MAYIGNRPGAKYATLTRQTFSSPTGTSHTLSQTVTNSDDLLLYINNVKQNPADYTASGTTLTTASLAGGTEMYCLYYGKTTETVAPPASSVGDSHIVDMASSKLTGALPAISGASLTNLPAGNLTGTVADARISALTASKLTGALPAISGASLTNLPDQSATDVKFSACLASDHSNVTGDGSAWYTNSAGTSWSTPIINTGSGFSAGLFTVPSGGAGTYLFNFHSWIAGISSSHTEMYAYFQTSNRNYEVAHCSAYAAYSAPNGSQSFNWQTIADMDVGDWCKVRVAIYSTNKTCDMRGTGSFDYTDTYFQGVLLA